MLISSELARVQSDNDNADGCTARQSKVSNSPDYYGAYSISWIPAITFFKYIIVKWIVSQ